MIDSCCEEPRPPPPAPTPAPLTCPAVGESCGDSSQCCDCTDLGLDGSQGHCLSCSGLVGSTTCCMGSNSPGVCTKDSQCCNPEMGNKCQGGSCCAPAGRYGCSSDSSCCDDATCNTGNQRCCSGPQEPCFDGNSDGCCGSSSNTGSGIAGTCRFVQGSIPLTFRCCSVAGEKCDSDTDCCNTSTGNCDGGSSTCTSD